jgi:hypothetical protein
MWKIFKMSRKTTSDEGGLCCNDEPDQTFWAQVSSIQQVICLAWTTIKFAI